MKVLEITNQQLINYSMFMKTVIAKGKGARAVAKFIKTLQPTMDEYLGFEMDIVKEYSQKDEAGNLLSETNIYWISELKEKGERELKELKNETVVISLVELEPYIENLILAIEGTDLELCGNDLLIFDELLETLETLKEKG
ncbi:DUF1617 family protein [Vagococcus fluvialis]|uniref:DUF1617 family protein n=1 Tax=Vagococcus fluvialis TaxID=2738 RepID=UPI000A33620C|nr:DUF1617 family protein [Vagococcus fluvialis]MBO0419111.1 DUF1617 family protein [Vagococcus fluvialis]OTP29536.1 hypothetical protein A5798_002704 [Enterococcus sp. 6C8_DIV0013]